LRFQLNTPVTGEGPRLMTKASLLFFATSTCKRAGNVWFFMLVKNEAYGLLCFLLAHYVQI